MKRKKLPSGTAIPVFWLFAAMVAVSTLPAHTASADIYRWEDESGVVHFTDDISAIPSKYRGKASEIQKTPPASGRPSLSTISAPPRPPGTSISPPPSDGGSLNRPALPEDDEAVQTEKLRAKIDAKEQFLRDVDEKQSLATNPYRNRTVSPSDLELYRKYKEELPDDRELLKTLESVPSPVKEQ
jgi:hypothetical protein